MRNIEIHSCPELMDLIQEVGFLPLLGRDMCQASPLDSLSEGRGRTPQESFERMFEHLRRLLPEATEKQIEKLIK